MKNWLLFVMFVSAVVCQAGGAVAAPSGRTPIETRSKDPYLGTIVVEAATGKVLFENNADAPGYPASVIKLMVLLLIQERIDNATLRLTDVVTVTAEAARMGGSQVYLKEHETFPVEDLLYALIIQSANDAAAALAIHVGGTRDGFIELMNRRAKELGMTATEFHSVHGLPPSQGIRPDVSTARDLAILAREILKHPACLTYTSTRERDLRHAHPQPPARDHRGVRRPEDGLFHGRGILIDCHRPARRTPGRRGPAGLPDPRGTRQSGPDTARHRLREPAARTAPGTCSCRGSGPGCATGRRSASAGGKHERHRTPDSARGVYARHCSRAARPWYPHRTPAAVVTPGHAQPSQTRISPYSPLH